MMRLAAALGSVLLPFVVPGDDASAQTITNTAEARWTLQGIDFQMQSNEVEIVVDPNTASIVTYRPDNGGTTLSYRQPFCASEQVAQSSGPPSALANASVNQASIVTAGEDLFFEVNSAAANVDPNAIDSLVATLRASSGDEEQITIYESGEDTGVFVGRIATRRLPPSPTSGDCRLSLDDQQEIEIEITPAGGDTVIVTAEVDVLADPFGIVFDSETGDPVNGARVTLVDAVTGNPATVFAEDGVTPWPSTVFSGQPITDAAGTVYQMAPGEYWFPLTSLGRYRIEIEPPSPFTAPSVVPPEQIALLTRPDGGPFEIIDASYGGDFVLDSPVPVQIDVPLDRPSLAISLTKSASRASAQPGDAVFYTVVARNQDANRVKRNVILTDTPSQWLRLRPDSIRIDGLEDENAVSVSSDGRELTINLGDIAGGAERRVTYAMVIRADAPPGRAVNDARATDSLGRTSRATASLDIERDTIAGRMTVIGRVTAGTCDIIDQRIGIPGVRVMMEDGSFAITDADGRYHFDGVVPGTHVVQAARMTLPEGGEFIDCHRSTRTAGSTYSHFVIGQGGSLVVADFHALLPKQAIEKLEEFAKRADDPATVPSTSAEGDITNERALAAPKAETDWVAQGDGPDGWLTPEVGHNPRAPAIRVAIRHRKQQSVRLKVDGEPVDPLVFDGTRPAPQGNYAVSHWRGVPLSDEKTALSADILDATGAVVETITRDVFFTETPTRVEFVPELSKLIADGRTKPVVAVKVLDRNSRPLREGVSGEFTLSAPYQSAEQLERQQLNQLTGIGPSSARWVVTGNDGIALIELAPTMVSGSLRLDFRFDDGEISRDQQLETWIEPGDIEWTVIGLAEGSIGARTVADNMERAGRFDSDLGDKARVALYVKGRVLGKYLLTLAYDSAKQREDQRVLGQLDPEAYYTVFADGSSRRFDAASREKLYVRIETATFYALYGDFETGFDQTQLTRYNRVATGVKGEARLGAFHAQGFAAEIGTRFRRDEIQGEGITGPYRLGSRAIVPNSEQVSIEVRDRFRSELIVETRRLTRFIDYNIDLLSGTITFKEPVLSRDFNLNPQFIIINYEIDSLDGGEFNAGLRTDWTDKSGRIRVGASAITDRGDDARTDMGGLDIRAQMTPSTELRAEVALSRSEGQTSTGWLVEAQHQTGALDVLAYARSLESDYGVGQQNGAELGRRKLGVDARLKLNENLAVLGSVWQDDALADDGRRRAAEVQLSYTGKDTDLRLGLAHFSDRLADGTRNKSTVLEGGATRRLFDNKLELSATSSIALDDTQSIDLPARHRFGARYAVSDSVRLVGLYEIANGDLIDARTISGGIEVTPWTGGQVVTSLGKQRIDESGERSYAAFGLAQTWQVTPTFALDATIDGSRTLGGAPPFTDIVNPEQPVASGGTLNQSGSFFEDFTAVTLGAAWRKDRWSATARGEYRDGEFADRKGFTFGAIRQLGEGRTVGSGVTWTEAEAENGATTEIFDAALAFAHRPDDSEFAMLGKLEYRSDSVTNAVAGVESPAGRTALTVDGDATSRRLIASMSTNYSPRDEDEDGQQVRRDEAGLFLAARYNFDRFEGYDLGSVTALAGADLRIGLSENVEIGAQGTLRANLDDKVTNFSFGPHVGFVPAKGMLLTVGYNVTGFRDPDFSAQRDTDRGFYASVRMKIDADSFGFLRR